MLTLGSWRTSLLSNYPLAFPWKSVSEGHSFLLTSFFCLQLCLFCWLNCYSVLPTEIPLFHVLNARITFGNIFASDSPAPGVTHIPESAESPMCCAIDESCFDAPATYSVLGTFVVRSALDLCPFAGDHCLKFVISQVISELLTPTNACEMKMISCCSSPFSRVFLKQALKTSRWDSILILW